MQHAGVPLFQAGEGTDRAAAHAASIGWPKNSARKVMLPFGRVRFVLSDPHNNILLFDTDLIAPPGSQINPVDDPDDIRMTVEHLRFDGACADCGSTGHNTGSNTCSGPNEQDRLEAI